MLKNDSINIDNDTWYYEEKDGIYIVHWITERDGNRTATHVKISWRKLKASVNRKYVQKQKGKS